MFEALLVLLVLTAPFWLDWIEHHSRMSVPDGCTPSACAKIINVSVDPVGNRKTRRLKTVVFFSDGTQYITYKSNDTPGLLSTHMIVDKKVLSEIFNDAIAAHDKLCGNSRNTSKSNVDSAADALAFDLSDVSKSQSESTEPILYANTAPSTDAIIPDSADKTPSSETTVPTPNHPKARFCKLCGSPIDSATRICTGCGKQYFRPPVFRKKHFAIAAGVLACAAVVFLAFNLVSSLASQKDAAQAQVDALNARITELEEKVADQERQINVYKRNESSYRGQLASKDDTIENLREKNNLMSSKISFYDWAVVVVPDNGSRKYHKYGCSYLDLSDGYWIYNVENAKYQGHKACSHCCD